MSSELRRSTNGRRPSLKDAADLIIKQQKVVRAFVDSKATPSSKGGAEGPASYSEVVEELTGAQGTLAVISALLAGFAFSGLTAVTLEDAASVPRAISALYYITTTVSVAVQLFVCVVCTLLEQEGKVARGLAIARVGEAGAKYEEQLRGWYGKKEFAAFRTHIIWLFVFGVPCFAVSLAFLCLLKFPMEVGCLCFLGFAFAGFMMLRYILWLNEMFREGVLGIKGNFESPKVAFEKKKPSLFEALKAKEEMEESEAMLETLKNLEEEAGGFKKVVKTKKGRTPSAKGFAKAKRPSFFGGRSPVIGGAGVSM